MGAARSAARGVAMRLACPSSSPDQLDCKCETVGPSDAIFVFSPFLIAMVFTHATLFDRPTSELMPTMLGAAAALALGGMWVSKSGSISAVQPDNVHRLTKTSMILGDLSEYLENAHRLHDWVSETCLRFNGEPWRMRIIGQRDMIVFSTPEALEEILVTQFDNFPHGDQVNEVIEAIFGNSLATFDGEKWYRQRKTAAKFFTARALRLCMLQTMRKNVSQLNEALDRSIAEHKEFDLSNALHQFALQTFSEIGLGVELQWIGKDDKHPLATFHHVAPAVMRRFRVPTSYWKLERFLNIGPEGRLATVMKDVRKWFNTLIEESISKIVARQQTSGGYAEADENRVKSVVELFVEQSSQDIDGMRAEDLTDFLLLFVLAAEDTNAITVSWLIVALQRYPHVEKRIRDEMNSVLPRLNVTEETYLTSDHVGKLVYFEATLRESMRLYATVPLLQKTAAKDTIVCGDVLVREGDLVGVAAYALARNPRVWGPDAAEFKPERWINQETGELMTVPPTKFPAFSAGPRNCVGMKLGMLEVRVLAANLVHKYHLEPVDDHHGHYQTGITLDTQKPLRVRVTHTKRSSSTAV